MSKAARVAVMLRQDARSGARSLAQGVAEVGTVARVRDAGCGCGWCRVGRWTSRAVVLVGVVGAVVLMPSTVWAQETSTPTTTATTSSTAEPTAEPTTTTEPEPEPTTATPPPEQPSESSTSAQPSEPPTTEPEPEPTVTVTAPAEVQTVVLEDGQALAFALGGSLVVMMSAAAFALGLRR